MQLPQQLRYSNLNNIHLKDQPGCDYSWRELAAALQTCCGSHWGALAGCRTGPAEPRLRAAMVGTAQRGGSGWCSTSPGPLGETAETSWAAPWFVQPEDMKGADGAFPPLLSPHPHSNQEKDLPFQRTKPKTIENTNQTKPPPPPNNQTKKPTPPKKKQQRKDVELRFSRL